MDKQTTIGGHPSMRPLRPEGWPEQWTGVQEAGRTREELHRALIVDGAWWGETKARRIRDAELDGRRRPGRQVRCMGEPGKPCVGCGRPFSLRGFHSTWAGCTWDGDSTLTVRPERETARIQVATGVELIDEQRAVLEAARNMREQDILIVAGYAGTGKSTTLAALTQAMKVHAIITPTGKAAARLRKMGVPAATIHSVLYQVLDLGRHVDLEWLLREHVPIERGDMVVVDEGSMVGPRIAADIQRLVQRLDLRLVLFGDGYQLPPVVVGEEKASHPGDFSIFNGNGMPGAKRLELEHVHRQALDSPILAAATSLRGGGHAKPPAGQDHYDSLQGGVMDVCDRLLDEGIDDAVAITWMNRDRHAINREVRRRLGRHSELPEPGEPLMVLANSRGTGLMNGDVVFMGDYPEGPEPFPLQADGDDLVGVRATVNVDGAPRSVVLAPDWLGGRTGMRPGDLYRADMAIACKNDLLAVDWGYCSTAHKAQGSEWDRAVVHVPSEIGRLDDRRRWVYTAITRARRRLTVVYGRGLGHVFNGAS